LPSTSNMISLKAFPLLHEMHARSYRVSASAELTQSTLRVRFKVEGASAKEFAKIILPPVNPSPVRKNDLWKDTCFECFIPSLHSDAYLEFNGSPSGNWNLYSFRGYREGINEFHLAPESYPRQTVITFSDHEMVSEWTISTLGLRLGFMSAGENQFEFNSLGLTTVLSTSEASLYWALSHEGVKPDFHTRTSFTHRV
jgi:hypothetical protein